MSRATGQPAALAKEPPLRWRDLRAWRRQGCRVFPFDAPRRRWYAFARNAMYAALEALGVRRGDEVAMPAYHCVSLVEPVVQYGARCSFYGVDRRLRIDLASLEACLSNRTRVVVVIHYFGFPQALDRIGELCTRRGIAVVEDCSHALYSCDGPRPVGQAGTMSLFSLRKTLPVFDGAVLVANDPHTPLPPMTRRPTARYAARAMKWAATNLAGRRATFDVDATPDATRSGSDATADATARADERAHAPRMAQGTPTPDGWLYGYEVSAALNARRGSGVTRWVAAASDASAIRAARRRNFARLLDRFVDRGREHLPIDRLPDGVCPWTFPLDAGGIPSLDRRLRRLGVPAFTFGEALHAALPVGAWPDCEYLATNLVQLPVHQGITADQVDFMAAAVRQAVGRA